MGKIHGGPIILLTSVSNSSSPVDLQFDPKKIPSKCFIAFFHQMTSEEHAKKSRPRFNNGKVILIRLN